MNNNNHYVRFLKWFYGIDGTIDEYSLQKITTFGNNMYMLLTSVIIFTPIISILIDTNITDLIIICLIYAQTKQYNLVKKLGLTVLEVTADEVPHAKKKMLRKTVADTLSVFICMILAGLAVWNIAIFSGTFKEFAVYIMLPCALIVTAIGFIVALIQNRKNIIILDS